MRQLTLVTLVVLVLSWRADAAVEKWSDPAIPVKDGVAIWLDATRQPAAWNENQRELATGDTLDVFYDASGNHRDFSQPMREAQPKIIITDQTAAVRFDGKDDHLRLFQRAATLENFTIFLVACVRSNGGEYRAFMAGDKTGTNDYHSGFNIDMGPFPTDGMTGIGFFNVEGVGFVGARNLLKSAAPFEDFHVFTIAASDSEVSATANGQEDARRERRPMKLSAENLILGARCFSNEGTPPYVQGFLDGDIAEVIVYDRVLPADQRKAIEKYLNGKYERAADVLARAEAPGEPLKYVEKAPDVQMFVPGFTYKKLPVDLTNINNVRYRDDGKLVALAYDGNVYLLSDTNGDGLEDQSKLWWDNKGRIEQPIGMALTPPNYPHGRGVFVANKGKLSLLIDTDGDDKLDTEKIAATGWPLSFHGVDSLGVAIDPKDQAVYFGVGTTNFAEPLLMDKQGVSHYDIKGERGTIMRVAPDLKSRSIVCTGIRFSVGMAFNSAGDLFCTDQEGATWVPNGNPLDELLHIQSGRHYGFPARHPKHLPNVIDEPSTFDYAPQHQSTCGLFFNDPPPLSGGPVFGPARWRGDAIVTGESRGKIFRTSLAKTPTGYVARNQTIASLPMLTIDACVSPPGDLVVACHSGEPDWGSGPTGKGTLYKITYAKKQTPQPVAAFVPSPSEIHVAFDREIDEARLQQLTKSIRIDAGEYVGAGDRFEVMRPGYAQVVRQMRAPRHHIALNSVQITRDRRTLILTVPPQRTATNFGITLDDIDIACDMHGVAAEWKSSDGSQTWSGWLPHPDLSVSRAFTMGSAEHDELWKLLEKPGKLTIRTSLDLRNMLRPAVQPGSKLDFTLPPEEVTIALSSGMSPMKVVVKEGELVPLEYSLTTGAGRKLQPSISFTTQESSTPRPMALKRFVMPWATLKPQSIEDSASHEPIAQLQGGDWLRGRKVFFGNEAGCAKCHQVRGQGSDLGPDLSNLVHRDYESVMRDIRTPSAALNPDYIASTVKLADGRVLCGIMRYRDETFIVRGDADGEKSPLPRRAIRKVSPSPISMMPTGILEGIGAEKTRDLLTFLLTSPLDPAPIERKGAPPARPRWEFDEVMKAATTQPVSASQKPLNILLVTGPKDHGPSEHDYPAFAKRWTTLLSLADNVKIDHADPWPTPAQFNAADVAVFYSANAAWDDAHAKELEAYLNRGGGAVILHFAVNGQKSPQALADCIGLAWGPGSKFRHGALELNFRDRNHPIARGFPEKTRFIDESYWSLTGDTKRIHLLADALEENQPQPLMWTYEHGGSGRVFVSILGHYTWTFDDPLFRLLVLRGICWTAHTDADRLSNLAVIGARTAP